MNAADHLAFDQRIKEFAVAMRKHNPAWHARKRPGKAMIGYVCLGESTYLDAWRDNLAQVNALALPYNLRTSAYSNAGSSWTPDKYWLWFEDISPFRQAFFPRTPFQGGNKS